MDIFFEKFVIVYNIVVCIAVFIYPFILKKEDIQHSSEPTIGAKTDVRQNRFHNILFVLVLLVGFGIVVYGVIQKLLWIFIPITVLSIIESANNAFASLTVINGIISGNNTEIITKREKDSIITLAVAVLMLNNLNVPNKILYLGGVIQNKTVSDWTTIIVGTTIITLYCFLMGVLIQIPIVALKRGFNKLRKYIKKDTFDSVKKHYKSINECLVEYEFFSIRFVQWTLLNCKITRILWIMLIITIPFDIVLKALSLLIAVFMSIGIYLFYITKRLALLFSKLSEWYESISDRRAINIIFRSAFIVSITLVVIINRYFPFLHNYDATTGVLEFLASAIVIPTIMAWIIEYKEATKNLND